MQGKALCVSLRCAELRRCAPSEADEERASPERNMWMPGRQRNALVCLCALVRRRRVYAVCVRHVRSLLEGRISRKCAAELDAS